MSVSYTLLNNSSQRIKYQWAVWKVIFWIRFQMQIDAFHTVLSFGEFLCPRFWHRTNIVDMVLLSHVICYGWSACFCRRILPIYLCWSAAAGRFHFQNDCYSACTYCDELITSDFQWRCIMLVNKYKRSFGDCLLYYRVVAVLVLSMCGRLETEAAGQTRAAVTVTLTVSIHCQ